MECTILPWTRELTNGQLGTNDLIDEVMGSERFYYSEWVDVIRDPQKMVEKRLSQSGTLNAPNGKEEDMPLEAVICSRVDTKNPENGIQWWIVYVK